MRTYGISSRGGLFAVVALATGLVGHEARAGWPPPPDATAVDLADPKNWPNDPAYGFAPERDGQWALYGFLPAAAPGVVRRNGETAAGMSIDLAWRYSVGDPRVIIAVTDSGVRWDEPDLVDKIFLNHRELSTHKPLHANQSPCGGTGELVGYDCNDDGAFTVSDYAESLSVPADDRNGNGVLDAGDLIRAFSDGIDDDGNGYVDDLAGWDFMKDDNDPFDDTRDDHGTIEAQISAAATNNGIAAAGVCPRCRVVPLRVADSVAADAQDFAQAVVYATDLGAQIVQSALDTPNMTRFAEAALAYAYAHDVLVVTATSSEGARHHDMPATSNHTLAAHALGFDGTNVATSTSFLFAPPCAHYGGQNLLSVSSPSCGSGVAGALAGIAGLMASTALQNGLTPPLKAGEMQTMLLMAADDIDLSESRRPGSHLRYSQPGFDEHFGYGRINANRAVEAILAKRVPPEVNLVSPRWFEVLYADLVGSPIEIRGSIAAPRANAYDYVVEWARGVEPLDEDFAEHVIAKEENIDPTVKIGDSTPLALLDVRNVAALLTDDPSIPQRQNDHAITVRVRSVAHYGGEVGDVPGEMRRAYFVHTDPDLVPGFPLALGDSLEGSPKMADINGDGVRDLVVLTSGGAVHAFALSKGGPSDLPGFPFQTNVIDGLSLPPQADVPNYNNAAAYVSGAIDANAAREGFINAPAIADLDGDGAVEIVASSFAGTIYVIAADGSSRPGFPKALPRVPSCPVDPPNGPCMNEKNRLARGAFASPVLVDLDGDGKLDIVQAAFDGKVYAFDHTGEPVSGFPIDVHFKGDGPEPARNRIMTTPAAADLNEDGVVDLVVGSNERLGPSGEFGAVYVLDGRGTKAPEGPVLVGWPITIGSTNIAPLFGEGVPNAPVVARFGAQLAVVVHGNGSSPLVLPAKPGPQTSLGALPGFALPVRPDPMDGAQTIRGLDAPTTFGKFTRVPQPNEMLPLLSSPAVGDLDQDGVVDVIAAGGSAVLAQRMRGEATKPGEHQLAVWSGATGAMLPGSPFMLEDFSSLQDHAIADLDGDDYPEIITGTGGYFLHAYDGCGREPKGFPKFTGQWIASTPAVGDLDGDGSLELAVGTRSGFLYVWRTRGTSSGVVAWESYHHDNRNTGNLEVPLEQGVLRRAAQPLTEETCREPRPSPTLRGGGGCSCRVADAEEPALPIVLLAGGVGFAITRRRVRR